MWAFCPSRALSDPPRTIGESRGGDMKNDMGRAPGRNNRKMHYCAVSGKIRYRDGHDAMLALERLRRQRAKAEKVGATHRIHVVRKYRCDACGGWHLTSQPRADGKNAFGGQGLPTQRRRTDADNERPSPTEDWTRSGGGHRERAAPRMG
jgi:hypothetical protein